MPETIDTDATHLLADDHREVEDLFKKFENASGKDRKEEIARQICQELKIHAMIEEEIFYPALKGKIDDEALLKEAYVEHDSAKLLINEIEAGGPDETFYDSKVKVLQEQIEHHVKEEEKMQGNLFQQARAAEVDLDSLGEQMKSRKEELKQMAQTQGLPAAEPTTM